MIKEGITAMSIPTAASATYHRDLGEGLIERWSTREDTEHIADLCSKVFRDSEEEAFNEHMRSSVRLQMRGDHHLMGPGDYALVEDTRKEGNPVVACTCLWRSTWEYEGIPFGLGQPEYVATDPAYRKRGLIRGLFNMLHARSEAEGDLVQAITGISYFYRQFGYEYALELEGHRVAYLTLIPKAGKNRPRRYTLPLAASGDIPHVMELHDQQRQHSMVWSVASERFWRFQLEAGGDPLTNSKQFRLLLLVDQAGVTQGYLLAATKRRSSNLMIMALNIAKGVSWQIVVVPILRALQSYGEQLPVTLPSVEEWRGISFMLGSSHPVYDALGQALAPSLEPPYAWYVRVPNLLAFLDHIAPALEARLANSVAASYTGELKIDLYRGGLRMIFDQGHLRLIEPWRAPLYKSDAKAACPALVFLQLLFGYRSLDELRYAFPDIEVEGEAEVLLKALFPRKFTWVLPLG